MPSLTSQKLSKSLLEHKYQQSHHKQSVNVMLILY
jgi:hypothetical protein